MPSTSSQAKTTPSFYTSAASGAVAGKAMDSTSSSSTASGFAGYTCRRTCPVPEKVCTRSCYIDPNREAESLNELRFRVAES